MCDVLCDSDGGADGWDTWGYGLVAVGRGARAGGGEAKVNEGKWEG